MKGEGRDGRIQEDNRHLRCSLLDGDVVLTREGCVVWGAIRKEALKKEFAGELGLGERHALPVDVHVSVDGQTIAGNAEFVFELEKWHKLAYWYEWPTRKTLRTFAICANPIAGATEVGVGITGTTTVDDSVVRSVVSSCTTTGFVTNPDVIVLATVTGGPVTPDVLVVPDVVVGERTASACTWLLIATHPAKAALKRLTILKGVGVKDCGVHECTKKPKFFGWKICRYYV